MWSPSVADRSGPAFSGHPLLFSAPSNEPKSDAQFIQPWRHTQEYEHNFASKLLGAHILYPLKVVNMREYPWNIYSIWNINLIDVYEKSVSCYVIGLCTCELARVVVTIDFQASKWSFISCRPCTIWNKFTIINCKKMVLVVIIPCESSSQAGSLKVVRRVLKLQSRSISCILK